MLSFFFPPVLWFEIIFSPRYENELQYAEQMATMSPPYKEDIKAPPTAQDVENALRSNDAAKIAAVGKDCLDAQMGKEVGK